MKNQPKWREEWTRLVGDHKYLAIRNWDTYQAFTSSGVPAHWIKSYTNADFDEPLSLFEGGLLDRLRRFRGRLGHNIPATLTTILSGVNAIETDRARVPNALCTLVQRGRLIPTNQQDSVSKKRIEKKNIEESNSMTEQEETTGVSHQEEPTPHAPVQDGEPSDRQLLVKTLYTLLDRPAGPWVKNPSLWETQVESLLATHSVSEIQSVMEFAVKENDYSAEYLTVAKDPMASFVKNYDNLHKRWKALQKGAAAAANRAAKLKPDAKTAPGAHGNFSGMEF